MGHEVDWSCLVLAKKLRFRACSSLRRSNHHRRRTPSIYRHASAWPGPPNAGAALRLECFAREGDCPPRAVAAELPGQTPPQDAPGECLPAPASSLRIRCCAEIPPQIRGTSRTRRGQILSHAQSRHRAPDQAKRRTDSSSGMFGRSHRCGKGRDDFPEPFVQQSFVQLRARQEGHLFETRLAKIWLFRSLLSRRPAPVNSQMS